MPPPVSAIQILFAGMIGKATIGAATLDVCPIDVTPSPGFPRFVRLHHRMIGLMEMGGRVLPLGRIAAADVTAGQAHTQLHPRHTFFQAFLAAIGSGRNVLYRIQMRTIDGHCVPSFLIATVHLDLTATRLPLRKVLCV